MRRILLAMAVLGSLTACGSPKAAEPTIVPLAQINQAKWLSDMQAQGLTATFPAIYDVTVELCNDTQQSMDLMVTLAGATPNAYRTEMQYVCPSKAHMVDDALTNAQSAMAKYTAECAVPPQLRTQEQQDAIDAIGPCP